MENKLATKYLGLDLAHPLIVGSSSLTSSLEGIRKAYENGAAAVVLKSLFEEQISGELIAQEEGLEAYPHPEALDYVKEMGMRLGPQDYLGLITAAKKEFPIPIIASINCVGSTWWTEYARQLEASGADAIELNVGLLATLGGQTSAEIEASVYRVVEKVRSTVTLPLSLKLGSNWSSLPSLIKGLSNYNLQGLVLFNRYYQVDISLETMKLKPGIAFSSPHDYTQELRMISILSGYVPQDLCASGGIHDGESVLKMILAGANAVQLCSVLYKGGYQTIQTILKKMDTWMTEKGYTSLSQMRGLLSMKNSENPQAYERLQYIKALTGMY